MEFGELAAEKAVAPAVKAFAERMVADHGAANTKLTAIAEVAEIAVPAALNAQHAATRETLAAMDAAVFDLHYMPTQVIERQMAAQLLEWEINAGQNTPLQGFAAETLPAVLEHLAMAMARGIVEDLSHEQVAAVPPATRASP